MGLAIESSLLLLIKIGFIIFLLVYIVFAAVAVMQVKLMTKTLELGYESVIRIISYLHLIFAIITFIVALLVL